MRRSSLSAFVLLLLGSSATTGVRADDLVPPGAKLELLYTRSAVEAAAGELIILTPR